MSCGQGTEGHGRAEECEVKGWVKAGERRVGEGGPRESERVLLMQGPAYLCLGLGEASGDAVVEVRADDPGGREGVRGRV
jgi:hypothetical protein